MILTCPSCSAKYMVSSDTIGESGRPVRCAKCKHQWVQKSEKDSLDDLISRIQSVELDEIGFEEVASHEDQAKESFVQKLLEAIALRRARLNFWSDRKILDFKSRLNRIKSSLSVDKKTVSKVLGGMVSAVLVFSVLAGVIILSRNQIIHYFPNTSKFFLNLGLNGSLDHGLPRPESSLAFDRLEIFDDTHGTPKLSGMLINLTKKEIDVPSLSVNILDESGQVMMSQAATMSEHVILAEGQLDFEIDLKDKIPHTAKKLEIRFSDPSAELPVPEDHDDNSEGNSSHEPERPIHPMSESHH